MKSKFEQLRDVLAGRADAETRQRIGAELENPNSELSILLRGAHAVAKNLLYPEDDERKPELNESAAAWRRQEEKAQLNAALGKVSASGTGDYPESYLDSLGIGDFRGRWKDVTGKGQCVCVLSSGVDESHPALRGQVRAHALFDAHGNYKEAPDAFDSGELGTVLAGIIAARTVLRSDLALDGEGGLRLGLAPECQIVAVNVLGGTEGNEVGSLKQFLAGIDWAIEHQHHPTLGGYEVVLMGVEVRAAFSVQLNECIDDILDYARASGLIPILAAGNRGSQSTPLGTRGLYVGACDRHGKPWERNGRADLLAPGVDQLCCQPQSLVGQRSGTALAAAMVAGAIVLLRDATGKTAQQCVDALRATADSESCIFLDAADDYLRVRNETSRPAPPRKSQDAPRLQDAIERVRADPTMSAITLCAD